MRVRDQAGPDPATDGAESVGSQNGSSALEGERKTFWREVLGSKKNRVGGRHTKACLREKRLTISSGKRGWWGDFAGVRFPFG